MSNFKLDQAVSGSAARIINLSAAEIKAWHKLMSITCNYPEKEPPKMDRSYFWCGTMEEQNKLNNK